MFLYKSCFANLSKPKVQTRTLFHWINLQFNVVDEERRKQLGPDRTCAEWILRNGGSVKFVNQPGVLDNYNELPKEEVQLQLLEINATNCSIMHNGFPHLEGCKHINKVVFHKCNYLEDEALKGLKYIKNSLLYLQISGCHNLSDQGLLHVNVLSKLKEFIFYDLTGVKNKEKIVQALKSNLPQCHIQFK